MIRRLGEILVSLGACDSSQVNDAVDDQVVYGGRLGTNLLEMGAVTESVLAGALGRRYGVSALYGEIVVDRRLLVLIRREVADRFEVIPYALAGRRLSVLCADPFDLAKLDELAFITGLQIVPIVVPEARLWELLRACYGLVRPTRGLVDPARRRSAISLPPEPVPAGDLMDEAAFAALYANGTAPQGQPASAAPGKRPQARPGARATAWSAEPGDPFRGALVSSDEVLAGLQAEASAHRGASGPVISIAPEPLLPPLSFAEAAAALAGVADRAAIARIVLRYARSRFRRAILLTVRGRSAEGWEGMGDGLTPQTVARVHVALGSPGVIQTVVESRSHFLGPLARTEANVRLLRALGGGAPKNAFAMPILARGKVVNVLYADRGRGGIVDADAVGELLILAARIGQSYDVLLQRER